MASFKQYSQTSGDASEAFSIKSFTSDEIKVYVDNVLKTAGTGTGSGSSHDYELQSYTVNGGTIAWVSGKIPAENAVIRIIRDTDVSTAKATYSAGSSVKAGDLNDNQTQALRSLEEQDDQLIQTYDIEDSAVTTAKIKADAITNAKIADTAVNTENITDNAVTTQKILNANITTAKLGPNSVTSEKIANGTIVNEDLSNTADIAVNKLADGNARQLLQTSANGADVEWTDNVDIPGTLDVSGATTFDQDLLVKDDAQFNSHINLKADGKNFTIENASGTDKFTVNSTTGNTVIAGNLNVTGEFDVTGTSNYTGQQTVPGGALVKNIRVGLDADNEVSTSSGSLVLDSASGAVQVTDNLSVTGDQTIGGTLTVTGTTNLAASSIGSGEIANDSINSQHYVDGSIDNAHLADDAVDTQEIANNAITAPKINAAAVENGKIAPGAVTADKLNAATVITAAEQASATVNDTSFFTSSAAESRFFNASTGETIKDGQTFPDNDTTIATTAAINDRIIDLVDDVGGFVPIANRNSFPTANPDVNNGSGTIVSIADAGGIIVQANGTSNNSQASGATVTITGMSSLASTTIDSGFGMLVETTSTLHTYAFHRLVPKATEVTTVAGKATEIGRLGTADAVADMNTLGTTAIVSDMDTLADISSNITTVAGISSNVTTVAGNNSNVTTVAGISSDVTAVAGKATEVGRLGTADAVADMNTLGTAAIVEDMNLLGTTACVADMALLGDSAVIADMATIADTSNLITNIGTVAGIQANVTTVAGVSGNVTTVANNVSDVNNFADLYQIASSNPSTDGGGNSLAEGDLYFNTSANELKVYNGSAWQGGVTASGNFASTTGNTFTGNNTYNDNVEARFGTGADLKIRHDGTSSFIDQVTDCPLYIRSTQANTISIQPNTGEDGVKIINDGAVELYHNGVKKFETNAGGAQVHGNLIFNDNNQLYIGTSYDFRIYHDGSNSYIGNATGDIIIENSGVNTSNQIYIRGKTGENSIGVHGNGQVELYYDDSKKFETSSVGATVHGRLTVDGNLISYTAANNSLGLTGHRWNDLFISNDIDLLDNSVILIGTGNDLNIWHDGSNSNIENQTGQLRIRGSYIFLRSQDAQETYAQFTVNGSSELFYDNVKKFQTDASGVTVIGSEWISEGTIYLEKGGAHHHRILSNDAGNDLAFQQSSDTGANTNFTTYLRIKDGGDIALPVDDKKLLLGAGEDLKIYHDGSHSRIVDSGTGVLSLQSDTLRIHNVSANEYMAEFVENGAASLYYDGVKKLETRSSGVLIDQSNLTIQSGSIAQAELGLIDESSNATNFYLSSKNNGTVEYNCYKGGVGTKYPHVFMGYTTEYGRLDNTGWKLGNDRAIRLGNNQDLDIYHDGSSVGYIKNKTGLLKILSDSQISFADEANSEDLAKFIDNGACELYYDNSKKLETNAYGVQVFGDVSLDDGVKFRCGTGDDLAIYHDGNNTFISHDGGGDLYIDTQGSAEDIYIRSQDNLSLMVNNNSQYAVHCVSNGSTQIYHANAKKFETLTNGIKVNNGAAASVYLRMDGSGGPSGYLYGGSNQIGILSEDEEWHIQCNKNSDAQLYYDNSKKFHTRSDGTQTTGIAYADAFHVNDSEHITLGDSNDLDLYHDNGDSFIVNGGGYLMIKCTSGDAFLRANSGVYLQPANGENGVKVVGNGSVELFYDSAQKMKTNSSGVVFTSSIAGAIQIDGGGDIRPGNGSWTGNSVCKIQHHDNALYLVGGTSGTRIRNYDGSRQLDIDNNGTLLPSNNDTINIGSDSYRWKKLFTNELQLQGCEIKHIKWLCFNGTNGSIHNDEGISSMSRVATARYDINFSNNFAGGQTYAVAGTMKAEFSLGPRDNNTGYYSASAAHLGFGRWNTGWGGELTHASIMFIGR